MTELSLKGDVFSDRVVLHSPISYLHCGVDRGVSLYVDLAGCMLKYSCLGPLDVYNERSRKLTCHDAE